MTINDIIFKLYFDLNKPKEYAGFLLRFFAFIIDLIILSIFNYVVITAFNLQVTTESDAFDPILLISHPFSIIISWLYYSLLESNLNYQATIGKRIFKLKVVDINNKRISFARASGRFFAKIISAATLGIGFITIAFTKYHQGLHDFAAGTFVKIRTE